jgi:gluconolactonase
MTTLAFGGADRRQLYITEADTGSILRCEAPVAGKAMFAQS